MAIAMARPNRCRAHNHPSLSVGWEIPKTCGWPRAQGGPALDWRCGSTTDGQVFALPARRGRLPRTLSCPWAEEGTHMHAIPASRRRHSACASEAVQRDCSCSPARVRGRRPRARGRHWLSGWRGWIAYRRMLGRRRVSRLEHPRKPDIEEPDGADPIRGGDGHSRSPVRLRRLDFVTAIVRRRRLADGQGRGR
jgi:hypothetical protein